MSTREGFWREALSELSASGLSMRQFCRERNQKYHCAIYWRRRLGEHDNTSLSFATLQLPAPAAPPNPALSDDSDVAVECNGGPGAPESSF